MRKKEIAALQKAAEKRAKDIAAAAQAENRSMTSEEISNFDEAIAAVETHKRSMQVSAVEVATVPHEGAATTEFRAYLRGEQRASASAPAGSNNTGADGKFTNPNAFSNDLFAEITDDNGILSVLRAVKVSSDKLDYPTVDDTATGKTLDVKQAKELDTIKRRKLAIANVTIALNTYAVETVISNQLRDDNAVNLEGTIAQLASAGISRNASKDAFAIIAAGVSIADSAASGVVDYNDLVTQLGGVNGKYYQRGEYVMSQSKFIDVLKLVDANKRPIVIMPIEKGMKPSLFGKSITIDDNAADTIYFGDFSTIILAQNENTTTLVDIYSLSSDLATKYVTSARMGAGVLAAKGVVGLKPKA